MRLRSTALLTSAAAATSRASSMGFGGATAHLFVRVAPRSYDRHPRRPGGRRDKPARRGPCSRPRHLRRDHLEQNWAHTVATVMATHGRLDILFNNAGIGFAASKVEDTHRRNLGPRTQRPRQGRLPQGHPHGDPGHAQRRRRINHQHVLGQGHSRQVPPRRPIRLPRAPSRSFTKSASAATYAGKTSRINSVRSGLADTPSDRAPLQRSAVRQVLLEPARRWVGSAPPRTSPMACCSRVRRESSWITGSELGDRWRH